MNVIPGIITLVRSVKPAQKCNAKKEDYLLSDREIFLPHDYCPVCKEQFQTLCRIANHPSKDVPTGPSQSTQNLLDAVNRYIAAHLTDNASIRSGSSSLNEVKKGFDIAGHVVSIPVDQRPQVPATYDPLFQISGRGKRSQRRSDGTITEGTLDIFRRYVTGWKVRNRELKVVDLHEEHNHKFDARLKVVEQAGDIGLISLVIVKRMSDRDDQLAEFVAEDCTEALECAKQVLEQQPWRRFICTVLTDTRRFEFYRATRVAEDHFECARSSMFIDRLGWDMFSTFCAQPDERLGFVHMSVKGWTLGATLGVGKTAVVAEALLRHAPQLGEVGVVKIFTEPGQKALEREQHERNVLQELALLRVPNIPTVVPHSPTATTHSGLPVLLMEPRAYPAGSGGVYPVIWDYLPLIIALKYMHRAGYTHNDAAPENILFTPPVGCHPHPTVLLADFGGASRIDEHPHTAHSRELYYDVVDERVAIGVAADLRALVLSMFVLTVRHGCDPAVQTAEELCKYAERTQPWINALRGARRGDHDAVMKAFTAVSVALLAVMTIGDDKKEMDDTNCGFGCETCCIG